MTPAFTILLTEAFFTFSASRLRRRNLGRVPGDKSASCSIGVQLALYHKHARLRPNCIYPGTHHAIAAPCVGARPRLYGRGRHFFDIALFITALSSQALSRSGLQLPTEVTFIKHPTKYQQLGWPMRTVNWFDIWAILSWPFVLALRLGPSKAEGPSYDSILENS